MYVYEIKGYSLLLAIVSFNNAARCAAGANPALGAGYLGGFMLRISQPRQGCGKLRFLGL
jgi:hypothetical protein